MRWSRPVGRRCDRNLVHVQNPAMDHPVVHEPEAMLRSPTDQLVEQHRIRRRESGSTGVYKICTLMVSTICCLRFSLLIVKNVRCKN